MTHKFCRKRIKARSHYIHTEKEKKNPIEAYMKIHVTASRMAFFNTSSMYSMQLPSLLFQV